MDVLLKMTKNAKLAKKNGQLAIFKNENGQQKCVNHAGFRPLWPKTHFFFILYDKKKLYNNIKEDGHLATNKFTIK